MTKLQKFSLNELSDLSYGITVMTQHYAEFIAHNSYCDDDSTSCAYQVISLQKEMMDEMRKRIPESDMDEFDKNYQKKLLNSQQ